MYMIPNKILATTNYTPFIIYHIIIKYIIFFFHEKKVCQSLVFIENKAPGHKQYLFIPTGWLVALCV
jgi:hypothetical protein